MKAYAELEDSILIFDEAHNIEDVARDAASLELDLDTVTEMIISLSRAVKYNMKPEVYEPLSGLMNGIKSWIQQQTAAIKQVCQGSQEFFFLAFTR